MHCSNVISDTHAADPLGDSSGVPWNHPIHPSSEPTCEPCATPSSKPTEPPTSVPTHPRTAATRPEQWMELKNTCVSEIYESVQLDPKALEIVDQYVLEKKILSADDDHKVILASELIIRLTEIFGGKIEVELGELSSQFTNTKILPKEKVSTGIDRISGIVHESTRQKPTVEAQRGT